MQKNGAASASRPAWRTVTNSTGMRADGKNQMPDMTLLGFIAHLAHFAHRLHEEQRKGFERAAKIVEAEAKKELGTYQGAAGPFSAWAELADATKDDRVAKGFSENDPGLRTGEMRDHISHTSDGEGAVVGSDDDKMVWFELGTSKQPPRSVLGMAAVHKEHEVAQVLGQHVVTALIGKDVFGGSLKIK